MLQDHKKNDQVARDRVMHQTSDTGREKQR